jgi:Na+/H+ antiporter NhaD/arsenite permease-like protein
MVRITVICIAFAALIFVLYLLFSKRQKPWDEMTENEQQKKKAMIVGGTLVFLAGMIAAFFLGKKK